MPPLTTGWKPIPSLRRPSLLGPVRRMLLVLIVWIGALGGTSTPVRGESPSLPPPTPLPPGAIARLGGFGDTDRRHGVSGIRFAPDGERVAILSVDQTVRVYETANGRLLAELDGYQEGRVADFLFTVDGEKLLVVSNDNDPLIIWNVATGLRERAIDLLGYRLFLGNHPDEFVLLQQDRVVTFSIEGNAERTLRYLVHNRPQAIPLSLSPDGRQVLLYSPPPVHVGSRHTLSLHEIATSQDVDFPLLPTPVVCAEFSPTSDQVAIVCRNDGHVYLRYASDSHRQQALLGNRRSVRDVCYSPDGRQLLAAGSDGTASVWEVATTRPLMTVEGHGDRLTCVAISPGARYLVTGSAGRKENCALVWDWHELLFPSTLATNPSLVNVWDRLGSGDPIVAYRAVGSLVGADASALGVLESMIKDVINPASPQEVAGLIERLDHPSFVVRENASERLRLVRAAVLDELTAALASARSVEMRLRLQRLVSGQGYPRQMSPVERRGWERTIYALEVIDTDEANELLRRIAAGQLDRDLADEAAAALAR